MSSHDGVSCDACGKNNFRSKRYKCLICYDYDLCSVCYEQGETSSHHTIEHPMQCILTRHDFDSYYHGERYSSDQAQSFTCPFCGEMGFALPFSIDPSLSNPLTHSLDLFHHLQLKHMDDQQPSEVICPICASMVNGEPNLMTPDLLSHIANDHQQVPVQTPSSAGNTVNLFSRQTSSNRDFDITGSSNSRATFRRGPLRAPSRRGTLGRGGGTISQHFVADPSAVSSVTDPIADLLTQLSAVRRLAAATSNNTSGSSSSNSNTINLQTLTRQQYERERLRAVARSHHHAQSSNQNTLTSTNSTNNSLVPASTGTTTATSSSSTTTSTANVSSTMESDFFDSLFSSALSIEPNYSSSNGNQTWAQVVAQPPIPTLDQQQQQIQALTSSTTTVKSTAIEPDPSLLRKIYEETTLVPASNHLQTQQQKRRSDFLHSLIFSSFACPHNDNDK